MKRILVLFIALVYFAVSSGFTVHLHYCMGHFVDATFTNTENESHECTHCGMTKKIGGNGCCHDQHKIIKSDVDHSLVKQLEMPVPAAFSAILPASYFSAHQPVFVTKAVAISFRAHAPPDPDDCPLFLKMRNLRI